MTIEQYIEDNGISEILHFTTERGLTGCAGTGLVLSRKALNAEQYLSYISSKIRLIKMKIGWITSIYP